MGVAVQIRADQAVGMMARGRGVTTPAWMAGDVPHDAI